MLSGWVDCSVPPGQFVEELIEQSLLRPCDIVASNVTPYIPGPHRRGLHTLRVGLISADVEV